MDLSTADIALALENFRVHLAIDGSFGDGNAQSCKFEAQIWIYMLNASAHEFVSLIRMVIGYLTSPSNMSTPSLTSNTLLFERNGVPCA